MRRPLHLIPDAHRRLDTPTAPSTGPSPALRARAEAGWQRFLDRWPETPGPEVPGPEVQGPEETETPEGPEG
ncbi:hypothetical protein AB0C52_18355 [Streptomyces sp. NPDC048717]|uniref:hypothetical protein n=1 Tax=Streptomyces sp. NPDC048717 TaxID=3154928 RepID=UPI003436252C